MKLTNIIRRFKKYYYNRQRKLYDEGVFKSFRNSSGYVLVIVLMVVSLLITLSTEFLGVSQTNINYIRKFSSRLQAQYIAKAGMNIAILILKADKMGLLQSFLGNQSVSKNIDCYKDIWALNFPELPWENGSLKVKVDDENSKINLSVMANEIVDQTPYYGIVQRFFLNMGLSMDFADIIMDWIDVDDSRYPYGAESSDYYLSLESPYTAKNAAMDSIDELLMVKDMTPEIFYGLENSDSEPEGLVDNNRGSVDIDTAILKDVVPDEMLSSISGGDSASGIGMEKNKALGNYLRVYGERGNFLADENKININTASYRVLSSLTDNMTDDIVTELIRRRLSKPFNSVDEVKDLIEDENVRKNLLSVNSSIFRISSTGTYNQTSVKIEGVYFRNSKKFVFWSEE